ncbi:MAG: amidohydrolase family protein [Chloroflexota bacterium]|nr:MAG: amidohydrolase family protein [Chloroflexota bacterium]
MPIRPLILTCAGVVDGTGSPAIRDAAIRIEGERVVAVGPVATLRPHPDEHATVVDHPGLWICPGLIDEHTHLGLAGDGRAYEEMAEDSDEMMVLAGVMNLGKHLRSGVTTLRDNGARNQIGFTLRDGAKRGYFPSPRMLVCGRPITCTGGHFWWCNEEADGEAEIRKAVRRLVHEGADHIKIMASGGGTRGTIPGRASYTESEMHAAIHEAHLFGRLTVAHCRAKESMVHAVNAGLDLMEHAEFLDPDGVMRFDPEIAAMMRECGVYISPTLQAAGYPTVVALRAKRGSEGLTKAEEQRLKAAEERVETRVGHFRQMLDLGLLHRMVAGSDAGCGNLEFGHLDYDFHLMHRGGMSAMQILESATRITAEAIGFAADVGTLEPGKLADLIVVDGDPSSDVTALSRVRAVYQTGQRVV